MQQIQEIHSSKVFVADIFDLQNDPEVMEKIHQLLNANQPIDLYIQNDQSHLKNVQDYESLLQSIYIQVNQRQQSVLSLFDIIFQSTNPNHLSSISVSDIIHHEPQNKKPSQPSLQQNLSLYKRAALGGTFDYLHVGHKLLLSIGLILTDEFLTIGVTGDNLLVNKKNKEVLQSFQTRSKVVELFCKKFKPSVEIDLAHLNEPAGPTKDGIYDGLVVTEETQGSIKYINDLRQQSNLDALDSYIIKLIINEDTSKISSSIIREQILVKNNINSFEFRKIKEAWQQLNSWAKPESIRQAQFYFETTMIFEFSQHQRYYHNLSHISQLLQLYYQLAWSITDSKSILFSIFFHDLIYDPISKDNEGQSALAFKQYSDLVGISLPFVDHIILQTKSHMNANYSNLTNEQIQDLKTFLDMDLSILGKPSQEYDQYTQRIRLEYKHYDDVSFRQGRAQVLRTFLDREFLFETEYFRQNFEEQAKVNLKVELSRLTD